MNGMIDVHHHVPAAEIAEAAASVGLTVGGGWTPDGRSSRDWICACDEMQKFKYCHCLLFVTEEGMPITEHLPEGHEGREIYGVVEDPTPDKGRALGRVLRDRED